MSSPPLRETYTLSDAVELIGRRLFSQEWTGQEYLQPQVMAPSELAAIRSPLEKKLEGFAAEHAAIQLEISRTIDAKKIVELKRRQQNAETRWSALNIRLNLELPALNEITVAAHGSNKRWMISEGKLLNAIRERELKVHDGRGHELNSAVWDLPQFRYYIELSIVVNSKRSGEPRWQAARIDRTEFDEWLKDQRPMVEPAHFTALDFEVRQYLKRQILAVQGGGPKQTKSDYRTEAISMIPGLGKLRFDRIWADTVPKEWSDPGAPKKKSPRS